MLLEVDWRHWGLNPTTYFSAKVTAQLKVKDKSWNVIYFVLKSLFFKQSAISHKQPLSNNKIGRLFLLCCRLHGCSFQAITGLEGSNKSSARLVVMPGLILPSWAQQQQDIINNSVALSLWSTPSLSGYSIEWFTQQSKNRKTHSKKSKVFRNVELLCLNII